MDCSFLPLCPSPMPRDEYCLKPAGAGWECRWYGSQGGWLYERSCGVCDEGTYAHALGPVSSSSGGADVFPSSSSPGGFAAGGGQDLLSTVLIGCVFILCFACGFVSGSGGKA